MDLAYLQTTLQQVINQYHLPDSVRYKNLAFSSKNLSELDDVLQTLRTLLPGYTVWQSPGKPDTPDVLCSKKILLQQSRVLKEGLILFRPEQWSSHWSLLEKQALWSDFSMAHGQPPVIIVFAESHEFHTINNRYFKSQSLSGLPICFWRPERAE